MEYMEYKHSDLQASNRIEEALYGAVGTSDCHKVGIWGGCGLECWVYQDGRCTESEELLENNCETDEDRENHRMLYPKKEGGNT